MVQSWAIRRAQPSLRVVRPRSRGLRVESVTMKIKSYALWMMAAIAPLAYPTNARAHWCDDLWQSAYNIVVRPASDTVTVPASGSATLDVFVQNNMGYALPNFVLAGDVGGTAITATRGTQKVANTLLPGEKAKYTLTVKKSGGGSVTVEQINFSVKFGDAGQSGMYPTPSTAKAVVIKKVAGTTSPASPLAVKPSSTNGQSKQLEWTAVTDFIDVNAGLDGLMQLYCAGRGSWNSNSAAVITSWCSTTSTTNCQTKTLGTDAGTKFDYPRLWAAGELAARKASLGCARVNVLRERLKCGIADPNLGFAGYAMIALGYLGDEPAARTFIQGKIDAGGNLGTIAKAALLLFGNSADSTKYLADVKTGTSNANAFVSSACAAALGIVSRDDATITSVLIPRAKWVEPDTADNGQAMYAAHLINLVSWDRRGHAANAEDKGVVTYIEGGTPTPFVPGDACAGTTTPGTGGATATGGTTTVATGGKPAATGGTVTAAGGIVASSGGTVVPVGGIVAATGGSPAVTGGKTVAAGGSVPATGGLVVAAGGTVSVTGGTVTPVGGVVASTGGNTGTDTTIGTQTDTSTTPKGNTGGGCSFAGKGTLGRGVGSLLLLLGPVGWLGARRRRRP